MTNNEQNEKHNDISINLKDSSVAEFTKRNVPRQEEVDEFEEYMEDEARDEEIDQGLNEIYQDDKGQLVDVKKLEKIKKHSFILSIVNFLFLLLALGGGAYWVYDNWYKNASLDPSKIILKIDGDQELVAGENFEYEISYRNESRIALADVRVDISLPNGYILKEAPGLENNTWIVGNVEPFTKGSIVLSGHMIGSRGSTGVLSAYMTYSQAGLSSEYKKEAFYTSAIVHSGIEFDFDFFNTALVGETESIDIGFRAMEKSFIKDFRVSLEPEENLEILNFVPEENDDLRFASYSIDRPGVWQVNGVLDENKILPVRFEIDEKISDTQELVFIVEKREENGDYYEIYREVVELNVMKGDLNLTMIANGERETGGVDFGQILNFSIVYNNKGDSDLSDVIIMAVLQSDFLDWTTLIDSNRGKEKGNTITWSKEEIPSLAQVGQDQEGVIDFSIEVVDFGAIDLEKKYEINAYAHANFGNQSGGDKDSDKDNDNNSNTVVLKINSDLKFTESLRYFNEDNIPVGSGPNPPQVGQTTTYKVFWTINNNLHELNRLGVSLKLPEYVRYEEKANATIGSLIYSSEAHELVWNIGRLPVSVYQANAYFSISITPTEDDRNKIMVLLPGSNVQALDSETQAELKQSSKAKTSKLDDDEIGRNSGIVE